MLKGAFVGGGNILGALGFTGNYAQDPERNWEKVTNEGTEQSRLLGKAIEAGGVMVKDFAGAGEKVAKDAIGALNNIQDRINGDLEPQQSTETSTITEQVAEVKKEIIKDFNYYFAEFSKGNNLLDEFIASGLNINFKGEGGKTLLHIFAQNGFTELAKSIIQKGANVNIKDDSGVTPLHLAAEQGDIILVQELLLSETSKADINVQDNNGNTPLHYAFHANHHDIVGFLFKNHADVNIKNFSGDMYHKGLAMHLETSNNNAALDESPVDTQIEGIATDLEATNLSGDLSTSSVHTVD
jgi:ankyrin repeat protein